MAQFFNSYFMQSEFTNLYRELIPKLNNCNACGITKCSLCEKFGITCYGCRFQRCKSCVKFFNSIEFFYQNSTKEQWDYICNFLHDCLRLHWITKQSFKDMSKIITSRVKNTCFIISSNAHVDNNIKKRAIYYMLGNRKYKFYFNAMYFFLEMVFYTKNDIIAALHLKYCNIFSIRNLTF